MQKQRLKQYQFPIRTGNDFKLLVDGDAYFTRMLEAIAQAQHFILLEQYLVKSGMVCQQFIKQLCNAAWRGVTIYLLLDDFGSAELNQGDRRQLEAAGIHLCFFNPVRFKHFVHSLFRNHRKSLLIDGQLAFVGGAGLADEFSTEMSGHLAWHDVMLEIQGKVVQDWCQLFSQTWQKQSTLPVTIPVLQDIRHSANLTGRLLTASPFKRQEINRALIRQLYKTHNRVWITSPYFVAPRKIRRHLRYSAKRGTDVRLLLPGPFSDHPWINYGARRHYMRLLKSGVKIFEYQPRFIHAKIELCDYWVSIGSSNLDRWNQRWNLDANQAIYNRDFADQVAELFVQDFADSKEITLNIWQQRPWYTRVKEYLAGLAIFWLEQFGRLYR